MQRDMQYCDLFASSQGDLFELTLPLLMNTLMNYFTRALADPGMGGPGAPFDEK